MNIFSCSHIFPSHLKILAGKKWTNFWQHSGGKQNKQKTALFAVPNWCIKTKTNKKFSYSLSINLKVQHKT